MPAKKKTTQEDFIKATVDEVSYEVEYSDSEGKKQVKTLILKRWTLRQQLQLSAHLSRVLSNLLATATLVQKPEQGKTPSPESILKDQSLILLILSKYADDLFFLVISSIKSNFNDDIDKARGFADSHLTPTDAVCLLFLIAHVNRDREGEKEKAEKKFSAVAKLTNDLLGGKAKSP